VVDCAKKGEPVPQGKKSSKLTAMAAAAAGISDLEKWPIDGLFGGCE